MKLSGLGIQIAIPVLLALATNGLIFSLGWTQPDHDIQPAWAPPGFAVGIVWTCLFACMGAARWFTLQSNDSTGTRLVTALIVLCLAYPFYTAGFQDGLVGLAGTVVTLLFTSLTAFRSRNRGCKAGLMLLPVILWLCFATALILKVNALNS